MKSHHTVLFLYTSLSSGHKRAAEAVIRALGLTHPELVSVDAESVRYVSAFLRSIVTRFYFLMLRYFPWLWRVLYDNSFVEGFGAAFRRHFEIFKTDHILELVRRHGPSLVVCTQALPAMILSSLKKQGRLSLPLAAIVTDFGIHRYWINPEIDLYLAASPEQKAQLIARGVEAERIQVTGIPIDPEFADSLEKTAARRALGLDPHLPTLLVMGGSRGLGPIEDMVSSLLKRVEEWQIIVVCGQNAKTYRALHRSYGRHPRIKLLGYVDNISLLMDAADLLLSKPGGMTTAESLAKGLPLLMLRPIPGQEERNAAYLTAKAAATRVKNVNDIEIALNRFQSAPWEIASMKKNIASLAKPRSAQDAAGVITALLKAGEESPAAKDVPSTHPVLA